MVRKKLLLCSKRCKFNCKEDSQIHKNQKKIKERDNKPSSLLKKRNKKKANKNNDCCSNKKIEKGNKKNKPIKSILKK